MPYQGAELLTHRCKRYAKENSYLYDPNGDALIKVADGYEVATPLPDDETDVLVTDFGANGLRIEVRKSSMPKPYGKRKRCKSAEEAITEFASTPDNKPLRQRKTDDTAVPRKRVAEKTPPCNCAAHDVADISIDENVSENNSPNNYEIVPDHKYIGDYDLIAREDGRFYRVRVGGDDAGYVDGVCQDYETARANFKEKEKKVLKSCYFKKSCAFTLTTYIKQSFADVQKAVQRLCKREKGYLFCRYPNLKCACSFLEPNANGGWHCHIIFCFYDDVPEDLYRTVLSVWKKYILVPKETYKTDDNLVDMRYFYTFDELEKHLEYLNPVSKKKRERLKFYPYKKKARQFYGDLEVPKEIIMPASEAKKLTKCERHALRHEIKILNASNTVFTGKEDLKYHGFSYYYTTDETFWNAIVADGQAEKNSMSEAENAPPTTEPESQSEQPHFSISIFTKSGEQFGKTMTEIDFNYNIEEAIRLADFYKRNSKLFGGVEVVRDGILLQQAVSKAYPFEDT